MSNPIRQHERLAMPPPPLDVADQALFLDIDGTLAEFADNPAEVEVASPIRLLLRQLEERLDGALAVLTGRALDDADRALGGAVACIAALHGQHCRVGAQILRQQPPAEAWRQAQFLIQRLVESSALVAELEDKGGVLALHYRRQPEFGCLVARAVDEIAEGFGLRALHGNLVSEVMPVGITKGVALTTLMCAPPFADRMPVVVGDDITDEEAFHAANALGGRSIRVGLSGRETAARYVLADVSAVHAWLAAAR